MSKMLQLALRNLMRNRRRSLATLLALAIGAAAILLFGGYTANVFYSMQTAYVRAAGHLQIQHADYFHYGSGNPAAYGIREWRGLVDALRGDAELAPMLRVVTPMLQFGGVAGNYEAGVSRTVLGTGVVPADVNRLREWNAYGLRDRRPHFPLEGAADDSAVIGQGVARVLQLCAPLAVPAEACPPAAADAASAAAGGKALPKDIAAIADLVTPDAAGATAGPARIELLVSQARGAPNVAALRVIAAESQGFKELDELMLILPLAQAQSLVYGRQAPRATAIVVQLAHSDQMPAAAARIRALLAQQVPGQPLAVAGFDALNPFYGQSRDMLNTIFGFIFVLIGAIVLFTVGNTMNAAVMERTVEVGTLRAIGLRQRGIRQLFIAEGLVLGVLGALAGVVLALLLAAAFNALDLSWVPPSATDRVPLTIMVLGEKALMAATVIALVAIAGLSAWWPARRASGLKIVEALRHA